MAAIEIGPEHDVVLVLALCSAVVGTGTRGEGNLEVRAELDEIVEPVVLGRAHTNVAARLWNRGLRAATWEIVEPRVSQRADIGLDDLVLRCTCRSGRSM